MIASSTSGWQPGDRGGLLCWSRSPLSRVRDIRIPLLIAQGANDPRVKQASRADRGGARGSGIDYKYMLFETKATASPGPRTRLKFYAEAERFLARYLGGRVEE